MVLTTVVSTIQTGGHLVAFNEISWWTFFSISYHYYVRRHDRLRRACIVRVSLFHVGSVANVALYIFLLLVAYTCVPRRREYNCIGGWEYGTTIQARAINR